MDYITLIPLKYKVCCILFLLIVSCTNKKSEKERSIYPLPNYDLSDKVLAINYCGSCHSYVAPDVLPKSIWKDKVLPAMGLRMGIYDGDLPPDSLFEEGIAGRMVRDAGVYSSTPMLSEDNWERIVTYYLDNAPEYLDPPRKDEPIEIGLPHFHYHPSQFSQQPPLTSMVKILPKKKMVVFGDGKQDVSSLNFLDQNLEKQHSLYLTTTPIHYHEKQDMIWLTTIGRNMLPSDTPGGRLQIVYNDANDQPVNRARLLIDHLQRPVDISYADLNQNGREDIIVCEFGNLVGKLAWYENVGNEQYQRHVLKNISGATVAHVQDINRNGLLDIAVLFAQGDEGISFFHNQGNGNFKEERILTFSPLNGSTYFELVDFNNNGHLDILYTSGDNADFSPILKDSHGIYVYLNDGDFNFELHYFYHLNGAYKALARDFDHDGDLDIAAISFFPDYRDTPEEGFVYLQNEGDFNFKAYTFPEVTAGRWIVIDADDFDQDGDIDLVLGSFVGFEPEGDTAGLYRQWVKDSPSVVVLENTIIP